MLRHASIAKPQEHLNSSKTELLGRSPLIKKLIADAKLAARGSDRPILITGPVGAGKTHLARFIHQTSQRARGPLLFIDCGALPDLESTLFGHRRGSFTGALENFSGALERGNGGIVVLDDVERLSHHQQDLLHRALVDGVVVPIGGPRELKTDIRFIATTNKPLEEEVAAGRLKRDFVSRLDYFHLNVPSLSQRPEDIPVLCQELLGRSLAELVAKGIREDESLCFDEDCWPALQARTFEDNVRALDKLVCRLIAHVGVRTTIVPGDIEAVHPMIPKPMSPWYDQPKTLRMVRDAAERAYILEVCKHTRYNYRQVARILCISPKALYNRLHQYGIVRQ